MTTDHFLGPIAVRRKRYSQVRMTRRHTRPPYWSTRREAKYVTARARRVTSAHRLLRSAPPPSENSLS